MEILVHQDVTKCNLIMSLILVNLHYDTKLVYYFIMTYQSSHFFYYCSNTIVDSPKHALNPLMNSSNLFSKGNPFSSRGANHANVVLLSNVPTNPTRDALVRY